MVVYSIKKNYKPISKLIDEIEDTEVIFEKQNNINNNINYAIERLLYSITDLYNIIKVFIRL
jgi:hypothetical protein